MNFPLFARTIRLQPGEVWLVGAGPGDPGLLTLAAWSALEQADVVVHDRLGCELIIKVLDGKVPLIDVGKTPGMETGVQEQINQLLRDEARKSKRVVRLKGGDPFVFGRGREEADYLADYGIRTEVIPGLSSALAAPALAGVPVTYRGEARSVLIATGHTMNGAVASLRKPDTLVFLMAVANSGQLSAALIDEGYDPETPISIIRNASTPWEERWRATLRTLQSTMEGERISAPCVVVIGIVAGMMVKKPELRSI